MELAEYGKVNALLFLHSASSIQATLKHRLLDIIKSALLNLMAVTQSVGARMLKCDILS